MTTVFTVIGTVIALLAFGAFLFFFSVAALAMCFVKSERHQRESNFVGGCSGLVIAVVLLGLGYFTDIRTTNTTYRPSETNIRTNDTLTVVYQDNSGNPNLFYSDKFKDYTSTNILIKTSDKLNIFGRMIGKSVSVEIR